MIALISWELYILKLIAEGISFRPAVMAERLRRWTWNPMGFPHACSTPAHSAAFNGMSINLIRVSFISIVSVKPGTCVSKNHTHWLRITYTEVNRWRDTFATSCDVEYPAIALNNSWIIYVVMVERLRCWTQNPTGFSRAGSNPAHSTAFNTRSPRIFLPT